MSVRSRLRFSDSFAFPSLAVTRTHTPSASHSTHSTAMLVLPRFHAFHHLLPQCVVFLALFRIALRADLIAMD